MILLSLALSRSTEFRSYTFRVRGEWQVTKWQSMLVCFHRSSYIYILIEFFPSRWYFINMYLFFFPLCFTHLAFWFKMSCHLAALYAWAFISSVFFSHFYHPPFSLLFFFFFISLIFSSGLSRRPSVGLTASVSLTTSIYKKKEKKKYSQDYISH